MKVFCYITGVEIPEARVKFLEESGIPYEEMTCVKASPIRRKKGIFAGEVGTSELIICDKVYNDSVRSVFRNAEAIDSDSEETEHPRQSEIESMYPEFKKPTTVDVEEDII